METLEHLRRQIHSTRRLRSVVRTMKMLSLTSIRQCEQAVEALAAYDRTVQLGLQAVAHGRRRLPDGGNAPSRPSPMAGIVIGSTWGMCGRFNEQLAERAATEIRKTSMAPVTVMTLGDYIRVPLERYGVVADDHAAAPEAVEGITRCAEDVLVQIERWRRTQGIDRLLLFYNERTSGAVPRVRVRQLLPLDASWLHSLQNEPWPTNMLPAFRTDGDVLFAALIREYLFVSLHHAFAASLAGEHSSRLASMQRAEANVEGRLDLLNARFHRQRQTAVTEEVLDITSGFEALRSVE